MRPFDLLSEIDLEKANIRSALSDITRAHKEIATPNSSPTIIAGAASYIAQCYGGIESILKRIVRDQNIDLPSGGEWHIELLKMFRQREGALLGILNETLFSKLSLMRKFRHVVFHGYGFNLDREMVTAALEDAPIVVLDFLSALDSYLAQRKS
jgi:uncharacterized protein YutE (UPF0331/DUF86 family)